MAGHTVKVDSERQIFEKLFMAPLFTLSIFARNLLRGSRRRIIFSDFVFLVMSDMGFELGLLNYDDFIFIDYFLF